MEISLLNFEAVHLAQLYAKLRLLDNLSNTEKTTITRNYLALRQTYKNHLEITETITVEFKSKYSNEINLMIKETNADVQKQLNNQLEKIHSNYFLNDILIQEFAQQSAIYHLDKIALESCADGSICTDFVLDILIEKDLILI